MLRRRNMMQSKKQHDYGYFIRCNGVAFKTSIVPNYGTTMEIKFREYRVIANETSICLAESALWKNRFGVWRFYSVQGAKISTAGTYSLTKKEGVFEVKIENGIAYSGDNFQSKTTYNTNTDFDSVANFYINGHGRGTIYFIATNTNDFYYVRIFQDGKLVREYIPNEEYGMVDLVIGEIPQMIGDGVFEILHD